MPDLAGWIEADAATIGRAVDLSPLDNKTVLITGVSGLIGLYLLAAMRGRDGITIHAVARSAPPDFLAGLFTGSNIHLHAADLSEPDDCRRLPAADYVIHAAGYGQPGKFMLDPAKTILLNTLATAELLRKTADTGAFLFLSSSEIYSGSAKSPHREDDIGTTDPGHARACYIEGKRCGEAICHAFRGQGKAAKIGRLALAYGPGTRRDDQRVLNSLLRKGLTEGKIAMMDSGAAMRTYGYVTDAAEMLLAILLHGRETTYNVGGTSRITIRGLADAIGAALHVPVTAPEAAAGMAGAPGDVSLDLSRARNEFGKTSFVPFDQGLARTIAWQRMLYGVE
jgi:nucleoside-diphosphate-sugar epimerase